MIQQAVTHARFTFTSDGDRLTGVLHLPSAPIAAAVATGPLTSVEEQATGAYALALARRGFAALAFDHRTFGESEGEPRQFENPEGNARDISAAVNAVRCDDRTRDLPVVAVGVCAGAGHMARASPTNGTSLPSPASPGTTPTQPRSRHRPLSSTRP